MAEKIRVAILDDYQQAALKMADWGQLADSIELTVLSQYLKNTREIITALESFDGLCIMRVIAWSQNLTDQRCQELGVEYVDKPTFLRDTDIITIHLKMGQRYRGLIYTKALAMM